MKNLYGALSFIGLLILIGTAGACDNNTISAGHAIVQSLIALSAFGFFAKLASEYDKKAAKRVERMVSAVLSVCFYTILKTLNVFVQRIKRAGGHYFNRGMVLHTKNLHP